MTAPSGRTESPPPRRRVFGAVVLVLFTVMFGARTWLAERQKAERERMFRSLAESSRKTQQEMDERIRAEYSRQAQEELSRSVAKLQEMQKSIVVPPPISPSSRPAAPAPVADPPRRSSVEMPHHFVVSNADLARAALDGAEAKDWSDRAARKELVALFNELYAELRKQLGEGERFPDNARVAAMLPRVEAALPRIEAAMRPGAWKKMALRNVTDFRNDLRDFAGVRPDGGAAP